MDAPARETIGDELPTSITDARSLKSDPSSIITVTPTGTLNVEPSASDCP